MPSCADLRRPRATRDVDRYISLPEGELEHAVASATSLTTDTIHTYTPPPPQRSLAAKMTPLQVAYVVFGVYLVTLVASALLGAFLRARGSAGLMKEHYVAGHGLGTVVWFFTMAASLFSGYSVSGIVNESYRDGWTSTRWIPAGIGIYALYILMAPRFHALGKSRGYMVREMMG